METRAVGESGQWSQILLHSEPGRTLGSIGMLGSVGMLGSILSQSKPRWQKGSIKITADFQGILRKRFHEVSAAFAFKQGGIFGSYSFPHFQIYVNPVR